MSTLSQIPLQRLAPLRRIPFWAQPLAVCALFAIVGVVVLDDYGVSLDEPTQRHIARLNAAYIATGDISALAADENIAHRFYGVAFEMPLLLAERALGMQDSRHIYLMRHLLTYLFFIASGFVFGMLAYRMTGSRWVALLAMLMFLLHPRLYVHSFVNTRDIPFASLLVIALYLAHRAFRRDTLGAFLLCGIGVGLAINLRVFGLMLLPMILAMRAPDLWQAGGAERKRILLTGAAFLAAALATAYIIHPYYWENPLRLIDGILVLSQNPNNPINLFMGELYRSDAVPWNYILVWFAITSPPVTLLLGALGSAAVCRQAIMRPLAALRDREIRFRILLLGCIALPVAVVIALESNLYNGWRHMHFLWAPFCLLAAVGLRSLAGGGAAKEVAVGVAARLPGWVRGGGRLHKARRTLAYGIAGVGLITTLTAMAVLHPHQQVYFNALTDAKTPGALANRYDMDYWRVAQRQSLEYLLARYPADTLRVWPKNRQTQILPQSDRDRLIVSENLHMADFYLLADARGHPRLRNSPQSYYLHPLINILDIPELPAIHAIRAYGSVVAYVAAKDAGAVDAYRAAYDDVAANGTPLARSAFDLYAYDDALYYLNANCPPPAPGASPSDLRVFLHIFPADPADLSKDRREHGFENRDFELDAQTAFFDGKCINRQPLPDYPITRIRTGQNAAVSGGDEWRADIDLAAHGAAQALYESILAGDYGPPVAQSDFDVYMSGGGLAYLKEPCEAGDIDARFFLHIIPADPADLPAASREIGFANLDFQFADHGARIGDTCVAERKLPDYAVERIRTGQFVSGDGRVWGVEFPAAQ